MAKGTTVRMWRRTIFVLVTLIAVGFGAVVFSLFRLQIIQGEQLQSMAVEQQLRDDSITAKRGTIYDCNMKPLAQSATVWKVVLDPNTVRRSNNSEKLRTVLIDGLSEILEMEKADIEAALDKKTYSYILKRRIESETKEKILQFKETALSEQDVQIGNTILLLDDFKRYYPGLTLASEVIGFTGADNQGLAGLEAYYDSELTGTPGRLVVAKNAVGTDMPFQYEQKVQAQDGNSLVLTLDSTIQKVMERYLQEGLEKNKVQNRACAIVMNVKTGAILGMAVKGDFDPNDPFAVADPVEAAAIEALTGDEKTEARAAAQAKQWRNKCVSDTYYPGSVFKIITGSMGLEEGVITESSTFECKGGRTFQGLPKPIKCWKLHPGTETFVEGICNSCNPVFMDIGAKLGPENFFKYFSAFGLTERTGIDLPGEMSNRGLYYTVEGLTPITLATESFGQNFGVTPIQMLTAVAAVANGGNLVQPHVVGQMIDGDGNIVKSVDSTIKRQVISADVSRRMCAILQQNATSGSGKNGYLPGYRVAGKTGTSEKVDKHNQDLSQPMEYIASYCGFAPADDPEVAMLVFFDEPHGDSYYGAAVAGPVFAGAMKEILEYLGVEPKYTDEELSKLDIKTPSVINLSVSEAQATLTNSKLKVKVLGSGETVVAQAPEFGKSIPQDGTVVLFTDEESKSGTVTVPKLTGLSPAEANRTAVDAGLNISVTGSVLTEGSVSVSNSQSIAQGESVAPGTVITVGFVENNSVM